MRHIVTMLLLGTAVAAIMAFGADNSLGTWKLNLEKSRFTPGPLPVKNIILTRQEAEGGVRTTATGEQVNGDPINSSSVAKYDGKEYFVPSSPWDTTTNTQVDANTFTATSKKAGGKYSSTSRTVISKDGKTMTTTSIGTDGEGKSFNNTSVFDKQ
jgi:hypothetical protein